MTSILIAVVITLGTLFVLLAAVGILRMPDTYLRMAVSTKAATLGIGLVLVGAALFFNDFSTSTRVFAVILFILLTAPVGAHLIGKASYTTGVKFWEGTLMDDLKGKYRKKGKHVGSPKNSKSNEEYRDEEDELQS